MTIFSDARFFIVNRLLGNGSAIFPFFILQFFSDIAQ